MKRLCTITLVSFFALAQACGSDGEDVPDVDCDAGTIPTYSEIKTTSFAKCTTCHSSSLKGAARQDAPDSVNFDSYAAAKAEAKQATIEVNAGAMPIAGQPKLTEDEKQDLYKWGLCGTPE
jgi:uncharacterized membrane protein